MHITEVSRRHLTVTGGLPAWVGLLLLIPMFIGGVFLLLWQPTTLTCVRGGDCTLVSSGLFGTTSEHFPAASLRHAKVEESVSRKNGSTYRVLLILDGDSKPMNAVFSSGRTEPASEAKQINDFVAGKGGSPLVVERDDSLLLVIGLAFVLLGLGLLYFLPRRYFTEIDGAGHEVRHRAKWLGLGRERCVPFGDMTGLDVSSFITINGRPWRRVSLKTAGRSLVLGYSPEADDLDEQMARIRAIIHPKRGDG